MFYKIPSCQVIHFYYVNSTAEVRNDLRAFANTDLRCT